MQSVRMKLVKSPRRYFRENSSSGIGDRSALFKKLLRNVSPGTEDRNPIRGNLCHPDPSLLPDPRHLLQRFFRHDRDFKTDFIPMTTVFTKIIHKEIPADILYEDEDILAFRDIHPLAPVHVLVIPKREIPSINDLSSEDAMLIGRMIIVARDVAAHLNISEKGYKLLFRVGRDGGQEVRHIHLHLIGGARLHEDIRPAV